MDKLPPLQRYYNTSLKHPDDLTDRSAAKAPSARSKLSQSSSLEDLSEDTEDLVQSQEFNFLFSRKLLRKTQLLLQLEQQLDVQDCVAYKIMQQMVKLHRQMKDMARVMLRLNVGNSSKDGFWKYRFVKKVLVDVFNGWWVLWSTIC